MRLFQERELETLRRANTGNELQVRPYISIGFQAKMTSKRNTDNEIYLVI